MLNFFSMGFLLHQYRKMPATFQTWIYLRLKRKRWGKIHPYFFFSHVHKRTYQLHLNCTSHSLIALLKYKYMDIELYFLKIVGVFSAFPRLFIVSASSAFTFNGNMPSGKLRPAQIVPFLPVFCSFFHSMRQTISLWLGGHFEAVLPFVCDDALFRLIQNNCPFKPFSNRFSTVFSLFESSIPPPFSRRFSSDNLT